MDPMVGVRMPPIERQAIETWAAMQSPKLTFSKALRHLAQRGLEAVHADAGVVVKRAKGKR
jgi:hypothetical protein